MTKDPGKREVALEDAFQWNDRLQELRTVRHNLGRALFIDVTVWGFAHRMFRDDAPKVFADIEAKLKAEIDEIEARFRALGIIPSEWTPPQDEDVKPEGEGA